MLLFHATYRPYAQSIKRGGLSLSKAGQTFEISNDVAPCIYFTDDFELSYSYAEVALDEFDDEKYDKFDGEIIMLIVNASTLNPKFLVNGDENIRDASVVHYWTYYNNIPSSLIGILNFKDLSIEHITGIKRFTNKYLYRDLSVRELEYLSRRYNHRFIS